MNVHVGAHTPPPFNEVPVFTRLFCDDLAERLRHLRPREEDPGRLAELPVVLYKLALPHVRTAPVEPAARERYLAALRAADGGDLAPLTRLWIERLTEAL